MLIWPDMIRLNIGKNTKIKDKALCSVKHKSLGRNFHYHTVTACFNHIMEIFLNHIRFRCGIACRNHLITNDGLNSSDESHLISGIFKNGFYHIGCCGFPLGSCNTNRLQFFCRMSEISGRNKCHGIAAVLHKDNRHICRSLNFLLHYQNFRTFCDHIRHKFMSVHNRPADADKKRTLFYLSGIIYNVFNFLVCASLNTGILQTL